MKKIIIGLVGLVGLVSANETIYGEGSLVKDEIKSLQNIYVKPSFEKTSNGKEVLSISINDTVSFRNCSIKPYVEGTFGVSNQDSIYFNVGGGVLSPSYTIWNNDVEGLLGIELQNEINTDFNNLHTFNVSPKIGVLVNHRLEISYKQLETNRENVNTLSIGYKF